ncbi:MAG: NAD-dependent epimerase/dehydratase family protein, partial [Pseudomonadota bacterium]
MSKDRTVLVTGSAGFIGFHLSTALLRDGWSVIGLDCLTDHTDVTLKTDREAQLTAQPGFHPVRMRLEEPGGLLELMARHKPELVVHLAGQAGVRHSIDFPRDFLDSNLTGTFELLEAARAHPPRHMLMASSSSAYGSERQMPFRETMKSDHQMSFYAATKKATENMAHSYAHLFGLPITMFRFFTVYGPWGRPDMAMFKFTKAILNGDPIDVYNFGDMRRDFTYIDDLIRAITLLTGVVPPMPGSGTAVAQDSLSP